MRGFSRPLALGILLVLPLLTWEGASLGAAIPKAVFFSGAVLLLGILVRFTPKEPHELMVPDKKTMAVIVSFILSAFVSAMLSDFPMESLWGGYARGLGAIDLLTLLLFGWCVFLLIPSEKIHTVGRTFAAAGGLASLAGFLAITGGAADLRAAMGETLGHPNFLAQLLTMTLPVSIALLFSEHRYGRWIVLTLILIQSAGLLFTGSRAGLIGVLAALFILAIPYIQSTKRARISFIAACAIVLLAVVSVNILPNHPVIRSLPMLERLSFAGHGASSQSFSVRKHLWHMAWKSIEERPIVGHGIGAVPYVLERKLEPELLTLERFDAVPDRVHSDPLERTMTTGLIGLAAWIILSYFVLRAGVRAWKQTGNPLFLALLAALIGHGISLLFGFPTLIDLAFVTAIAAILLRNGNRALPLKPAIFSASVFLLLILTGIAFAHDVRTLRADWSFAQWENSPNRSLGLADLERAQAAAPHNHYAAYLATEYLTLSRENDALHILDASLAGERRDARLLILRAQTHLRLNNTAAARQDALQASLLAPFSPFVWKTWGIALAEAGQAEEAVQVLEHLLSFSPSYWRWDGTLEERTEAKAFFKQNPDFRSVFLHLARARFQAGDTDGALEALTHAREDAATKSTEGVIKASQGKTDEALAAFQRALELDPGNAELQRNLDILRARR